MRVIIGNEPLLSEKEIVLLQFRRALYTILRALSLCSTLEISCAKYHEEHGDILKDMEDFNAAEQSYKLALNLDPKLAKTHQNLAVIYHIKGNYSSAEYHYKEAYKLDSSPCRSCWTTCASSSAGSSTCRTIPAGGQMPLAVTPLSFCEPAKVVGLFFFLCFRSMCLRFQNTGIQSVPGTFLLHQTQVQFQLIRS
ncbi:hypothetical protein CEXT_186341 [Caerostris extrusa]|uniref:Uncharacterized protein n=1 Tax=Caerostris extrusa TaxID=172846 RepID=A0AAV4XW31_CAEEX|nr:hypothetical protein CEXT_186341 [Caerostris extrusa]